MFTKQQLFYRILSVIIAILLVLALLERHSADSGFGMFSVRNIVEVGLIGTIGILIAILLKKYFIKNKFELPISILLKKIFSKKK